MGDAKEKEGLPSFLYDSIGKMENNMSQILPTPRPKLVQPDGLINQCVSSSPSPVIVLKSCAGVPLEL